MSTFKDQIEEMVYESRKLLDSYTNEYNNCLDGYLMCCRNHGKENFYHAIRHGEERSRTTISRNPEIIKALARKEYLDKSIKVLRNNIEVLTNANKGLQFLDIDSVRNKMMRAYQDLPDEYFFDSWFDRPGIYQMEPYLDGIRRHAEWAKGPYEKSKYNPEGRKFPTSAGFKVRSKSEQSIVEQLVNYGVPFRYEEVIWINKKPYAPDWTFRDRNLEPFYWEHAGMMDLPNYREGHKRKMNVYDGVGIVPWENLIVTYDVKGVINVPMIKSIIENEVLPRL